LPSSTRTTTGTFGAMPEGARASEGRGAWLKAGAARVRDHRRNQDMFLLARPSHAHVHVHVMCMCEEGFNIQQTGIEDDRMSASDVSSVPIVTNQSHPSSQIRACPDPEPSAAPSRARRASATSTSAAPPPLRAGLLGPRVVSPHPQGLQGARTSNLS
jgi:hypothetical protein